MKVVMIAALIMVPMVASARPPGRREAIYQADMKTMNLFAAGATVAMRCGLRSVAWDRAIQATAVMEAYDIAANLWGGNQKALSPVALPHFQGMGARLVKIRKLMSDPTPAICSDMVNRTSILGSLDTLAKKAGWHGN
jgi:hypothetical protein